MLFCLCFFQRIIYWIAILNLNCQNLFLLSAWVMNIMLIVSSTKIKLQRYSSFYINMYVIAKTIPSMIPTIKDFTYILFFWELIASQSFHIHMWATKYHMISQQNIKYQGIMTCFATQKELSHNIIFHLRNNIHTITVRNKKIHFITSKNTYMWLFYF